MGRSLRIVAYLLAISALCPHQVVLGQHRTTVSLTQGIGDEAVRTQVEFVASSILTLLNESYRNGDLTPLDSHLATPEGVQSIEALWRTRKFYCPETAVARNLIRRTDGLFEVRDFPLLLGRMGDVDRQEGVLVFQEDGRLVRVGISLGAESYAQIMPKSAGPIDRDRRQQLLDFVELFRLSYETRDLPYIRKVFSNDALIIVGRVLEVKSVESDVFLNQIAPARIELVRLDKRQYLERLENVFDAGSTLTVEFEEIEVAKHPRVPEVYGVTLRQRWTSTNYSDDGYLFLLINFAAADGPMIHVRTWQPQQYTHEDDLFGLGHFRIY